MICACVTFKRLSGTMETDSMDYIIALGKENFPSCYCWLICIMEATDTSMTIVTGFLLMQLIAIYVLIRKSI